KRGLAWESFLFGSIMNVETVEAVGAWGLAAVTLVTLWIGRRAMLFWAFDEPGAEAFGVRGSMWGLVLLVLLARATAAAMKLAGVVLVTAMLVLPGAIALRTSTRLWPVFGLSVAAAIVGLVGGIVMSFESDWPPGPCIVGVLSLMFAGRSRCPDGGPRH